MTEKLLLDNKGIHILDEDIVEKIDNVKISASSITELASCPAKWVAQKYVLKDLFKTNMAARKGSLFHSIMEDFFKIEKDERTRDLLMKISKEHILQSDFTKDELSSEVSDWLFTILNNYYEMGANPKNVDVAEININNEKKIGLELFVEGKIGNTKRRSLGFIDQLLKNPNKPGTYIISDWKTAAKTHEWKPETKSDDGLPEQRQQIIYSDLVKQNGYEVSAARLIFPIPKKIVNVRLKDEELHKKVIEDVEKTDKKLDETIETNTFECKPNFLCAWCPLAKICPVAMIKPYKKMQDAYKNQPDPDSLLKDIRID